MFQRFAVLVLLIWSCGGFVLMSGRYVRLDVEPTHPTISIFWDGNTPSLEGVETFRDGEWADLSHHDFMENLLNLAVEQWNEVPGAYVKLQIVESINARSDPSDKLESLIVKKDKNLSSAAYASPIIEGEKITDCDIVVNDTKTQAKHLIVTLVHELGHCLGLGHNHTNYNSIMGYSRAGDSYRLGADDMAGLIYLYPDPANDVKPPTAMEDLACGVIGGRISSDHNRVTLLWWWLPILFPLLRKRKKRFVRG